MYASSASSIGSQRSCSATADEQREHARGVTRSPTTRRASGTPDHRDLLERLEGQPGADDERVAGALRRHSRNGPGRVGIGALDQAERERRPPARSDPVVALRLGPDGDRRPAGRDAGHARTSAKPASTSTTSMSPKRQRIAVDRCVGQVDRGGVEHAEVGVRRRPSSAARRRAASTISGATSVESRRPAGPSRSAARKPVSPGPAASSRIVSPAAGRAAPPCAPRASASRPRTARGVSPSRPRRRARPRDPSVGASLTRRRPRTAGSRPCRTRRASPPARASSGRSSSGRRRSTRAHAAWR